MPYADLTIARHIVLDETKIYFWDNENTNSTRNGLAWATAYRDGEGKIGNGDAAFFKATDTPYRMDLNHSGMSNDSIYCDCTGIGFERSSKKADFRASKTFTFTLDSGNIYTASVVDVLTGARSEAYGFDYPGHYLFAETLNYEGAWGVWNVTGTYGNDVIPLTRVIDSDDLVHGTWHWDSGVLSVCWDGTFNSSEFEVVQKAKSFELWTDTNQTDARKSSIVGIRSRFGLFGHHNGACNGWRISDSELAWNAIDGIAIIAENTYAKTYDLYTQIYRCHIHHNYRDGITNYATPAGAAGRGNGGWFDVCADYNYIHDNGGAGIFLHRLLRVTVESDYHTVDYPFRINNNTIINNARGIAITDERMQDVIETFGYDQMVPADWEAKTYQQKIDYFNTLYSGYDTAYVKLRNNNIVNNTINTELITDTWSDTTFIIDSDYNNIYPDPESWAEGENSLSVDPQFTQVPKINGSSALVNAGEVSFTYPQNSSTNTYYYTEDANPYEWELIGTNYNIGASANGPAIAELSISRNILSFVIQTKSFQILDLPEYIIASEVTTSIDTDIPYVDPYVIEEFDLSADNLVSSNIILDLPVLGSQVIDFSPEDIEFLFSLDESEINLIHNLDSLDLTFESFIVQESTLAFIYSLTSENIDFQTFAFEEPIINKSITDTPSSRISIISKEERISTIAAQNRISIVLFQGR